MAETVTLSLTGLNCASCAAKADSVLRGVSGVRDASVNYATGQARLDMATPVLPAALDALAHAGYPAQSETVILDVENMSCASCVGRVERALTALPGVEEAVANLVQHQVTARVTSGAVAPDHLAATVTEAGYPAQVQSSATPATASPDDLKPTVLLAIALALPVFVLEMGGHLIPAWHHFIHATIGQTANWTIQAILTTLILFGPGRLFFARGIPALMRGAPDMNSLVALGTGAAYGFSVIALLAPALLPSDALAVYFEAAAVIVALILIGRWMEARAKGRAGAAIQALAQLKPSTALRVDAGVVEEVPIARLAVGDVVRIRPGTAMPVDGVVDTGESAVDESMITGEAIPVAKRAGDAVTAGTVNGTGALDVRATAVGEGTTLAHIMRLVADAQATKLPIQALVDRVTLWFVPAVLAIAGLTLAVWLALGQPQLALVAAVSVLIIACPCAMGLATPTSILVGTGRAAELGVLYRKAASLQQLAEVEVVAFDKTGTLTEGRPSVVSVEVMEGFSREMVLRAIAAVEASSEHPLARALTDVATGPLPAVDGFQSETGLGVRGLVEGRDIRVGSARYLEQQGIALTISEEAPGDQTLIYAAVDGQCAARITLADPIKPTSRAAIAALQSQGLQVALISGDAPRTADAVGAALGIDHVVSGVLPGGKVDALRGLTGRVAFVGDGINDAPALAAVHVGVAIGTGTDVAMEAADVVIAQGDPMQAVTAISAAKATMRNIRQNLFWAFGYNVLLIPVAAGVLYPASGVLLSPIFAAGAMALSSVFVVTNALRLRGLIQG